MFWACGQFYQYCMLLYKFDSQILIHWKFLSHVSSLRQQGDLTVKLQTTVCGSGRILGYVPLIFILIPSLCFRKHHYKSGIHSVPQSSWLFTYMKHQSLLSPLPSLWACKIYQAWKLDEKTRKFWGRNEFFVIDKNTIIIVTIFSVLPAFCLWQGSMLRTRCQRWRFI